MALLGNAAGAHYAPDARGLASAREAVSADYAARGISVGPERLILTASSSESYSLLFKLLANPGDEVLVPTPSYPLFGYLADLDSVSVRAYPLNFDHEWHLSVDSLRPLITERTRAVVVVHPNNPTGSFLKRQEAEALAATLRASAASRSSPTRSSRTSSSAETRRRDILPSPSTPPPSRSRSAACRSRARCRR